MAVAALARFLLNASESFICVLLVLVTNSDVLHLYNNHQRQPWGLYIRLKDHRETILPVLMDIGGPNPRVALSKGRVLTWSKEPDMMKKFEPYLVISVSDIEEEV